MSQPSEISLRILLSLIPLRQRTFRTLRKFFRACYDTFMPDKFTIGLVQMKSTKNAEENLPEPSRKSKKPPRAAHKSSAWMSFFEANIFAVQKTQRCSTWLRQFPARQLTHLRRSQRKKRSSLSLPCSSDALRAFITTRAQFLTPTALTLANTAKCTFRTTPCITRSFISLPAISAFQISIQSTHASEFKSAGISGIRKVPA